MIQYKPEVGAHLPERKIWTAHYTTFMTSRNKSISKIPVMGYKELDLYSLYKEVLCYGGFQKVVEAVGTWSKIWKAIPNFDPSITDSSFRLKKNYEKFLLAYEKEYFNNPAQPASIYPNASSIESPHASNEENSDERSSDSSSGRSGTSKKRKSDAMEDNAGIDLPLNLGEFIILQMGHVIPHPPFMDSNHIWPVGYKSARSFLSLISSHHVTYTCEVHESDAKPSFVVTAEDDPNHPFLGSSPSDCWKQIVQRATEKHGQLSELPSIPDGVTMFGLDHKVVVEHLRKIYSNVQDNSASGSREPKKRRYNRRQRKHSEEEERSASPSIERQHSPSFSPFEPHTGPYQQPDRTLLEADAVAALEGLSKREQRNQAMGFSSMSSPQKASPAPSFGTPYYSLLPQSQQADGTQAPPAVPFNYSYSAGLPPFNQVVNTAGMMPTAFLMDSQHLLMPQGNVWLSQKF